MGYDQPDQGFKRLQTLLDTIKKQGKVLCDFLLSLYPNSLLIVNHRSSETETNMLCRLCGWFAIELSI